jgi:regulatory protein
MAENLLYKTALNKAMAQCSKREYCCDDIRAKLKQWGVHDSDSDKIINTLIKENFINELRFASAFVKDKFRYNKWGKIKIGMHLKSKNISSDIIKSALNEIDPEIYTGTLKGIITAHRRTVKAKNQYDLKAKILRHALSKGFESSLVYEILNESEE